MGQCCAEPVCEFNTQVGSITGHGMTSGIGAATGNAVATPNDNCTYDGKMYKQDQTWLVGCDQQCVCEDAVYGYYCCYNRCPQYTNVPSECTRAPAGDGCCETITCPASSLLTPSTTNILSLGSGNGILQPNPLSPTGQLIQVVPTLPPGATVGPNTALTGYQVPPIRYCVYKNKMYRQSERWVDGCDYNCICEDASTGFWRCADMCLKYPPMNQYCQLIADPDSPCCKKPFCQIPGVLGGLVGLGSTPIPVVTTMPSVSFTPTESPKPATCVYKGTQYAQGQQWFDGCDSKCVCYDASSNLYTCSQRCQHNVNAHLSARRCSTYYGIDTSRCTMKPDPSDPACCTIPVCTPITATPPTGPTPVPSVPGGSFVVTNVPGIGYCDYKGTRYSQGQVWQDGCDYKCDCVDASEGQYQCNEM
ncbi:hypothetical protein C0Q70_08655 [Pomacea canaliculata]|uniref:VWFC domain-containing protein n=1 Tax=Pomacea canaliculata TaxID=400727 RepID=A0A2T7P7K0_POMCA|nr:hypothetical protein C0Q70_08655 [Pomacea canaliculata]